MAKHQGVVFPLYSDIIKRGAKEGRNVFAKFSHRTVDPGMELYLYASGENGERQIIAKGTVSESHKLTPDRAKEKFGSRLLQTEEEFTDYTQGRSGKDMLVLELEELELLDEPLNPPGNMTVAGLYLDDERMKKMTS